MIKKLYIYCKCVLATFHQMIHKKGINARISRIAELSIFAFICIITILYFFKREQEKIISDSATEQFNHEVVSLLSMHNARLTDVVYDYTFWDDFVQKVGTRDSLWFADNISTILSSFRFDFAHFAWGRYMA